MRIGLGVCVFSMVLAAGCTTNVVQNVVANPDGGATDTSDTASSGPCKSLPAPAGTVKPWTEFAFAGKTYKLNKCEKGDPLLQGSWRLVDFETEDPATPLSDTAKEVFTFDGNTFTDHLSGPDLGKETEQTNSGWYFCGDVSELSSKRHVMIIDKAIPNGTFGNSVGDTYSVEFLMDGANKMAFGLAKSFEGKVEGYNKFCRIGSTVNGHCCNDPFAK